MQFAVFWTWLVTPTKPTVSITLNGERWNIFTLRSEIISVCPPSPSHWRFQPVRYVKERNKKGQSEWKRRGKMSLRILKIYAVITLEGPDRGSKYSPCLSWTQVPLDLLGHVAQVTEKLSQQPGHIVEPSPGMNTAWNQQLWGNLLDGQSNTPKWGRRYLQSLILNHQRLETAQISISKIICF